MTEEHEQVILVNPSDEPVGVAGKLDVHRDGRLHRAFSVFVVRDDGWHLLQQRAFGKYHSGGRWSNACCGHPRPGERTIDAARRRLNEELGIDCELEHRTTFTYRADVGEGLLEHEIDHVFVGRHAGEPRPDPHEVAACRWMEPPAIDAELRARPDDFTAWFRPAWEALRSAASDEEPRASHADS